MSGMAHRLAKRWQDDFHRGMTHGSDLPTAQWWLLRIAEEIESTKEESQDIRVAYRLRQEASPGVV